MANLGVGNLRRIALLCALAGWGMVLFGGASLAESSQADWDKHAQPLVDVFGQCTRSEVARTWKSAADAEAIAKAAVATCEKDLQGLRPVLAADPFNASEGAIDATLDQVRSEMVEAARADIEKRRKGN